MAVVKDTASVRVKLVHQTTDDTGATKQVSRTYSNLVPGVTDDTIYAGMQAMIPLLADTPSAIVRVDETALIQG